MNRKCLLLRAIYLSGLMLVLVSPPAFAADADMILRSVKRSIMNNPELQNIELSLNVSGDLVTVSGTAPSAGQKALVGSTIAQVPGVRRVENRITVDPSVGMGAAAEQLTDQQIEQRLRAALSREGIPAGRGLELSVQNGVARFAGERPSFEQVDKILSIALNIPGIQRVNNEMTIKGQPYSSLTFKHEDGSVTRVE